MKPNNLVALLIVVILLAVGIALAALNKRSETALLKQTSGLAIPVNANVQTQHKSACFMT